MYTKSYLLNQLAVTLGGRVCEEIKYGIEEVRSTRTLTLLDLTSSMPY